MLRQLGTGAGPTTRMHPAVLLPWTVRGRVPLASLLALPTVVPSGAAPGLRWASLSVWVPRARAGAEGILGERGETRGLGTSLLTVCYWASWLDPAANRVHKRLYGCMCTVEPRFTYYSIYVLSICVLFLIYYSKYVLEFDIRTSLNILKFDIRTIESSYIEYWSTYIEVWRPPIELLHGDFGELVQQDWNCP